MQSLDISYNDLGDQALRYLLKLAILFPGQRKTEITSLNIKSCQISPAGAEIIGAALGSAGCRLETLDISANGVKTDGFVLICNGILRNAIKNSNRGFKHAKFSCCSIELEEQHLGVVEKLFSEAGLKELDLSGNTFASKELKQKFSKMQGVFVDGASD